MDSAHSCEKACVSMKTPPPCLWPPRTGGVQRHSCACILWQATVLKGGKVMAVRKGKVGSGSHLQLSCEIWHGRGAASEKQRNPLP